MILDSSAGQGDQLVYDENVRLAREIPAACLYLSNAISDHIATLTDIIGRKIGLINIAVKLDKLSLYGPGGHFATHKDTARVSSSSDTLGKACTCPHLGIYMPTGLVPNLASS